MATTMRRFKTSWTTSNEKLLIAIALIVLAGFAVVWLGLAVTIWTFDPTTSVPIYNPNSDLVFIAGTLGVGVSGGTAAFLGIQVGKEAGTMSASQTSVSARRMVGIALQKNTLLELGVVVYVVVTLVCIATLVFNSSESPDMFRTFAWGSVAWLLAAFGTVFSGASTD